MIENLQHEQIELLPSEVITIKEIIVLMQRKLPDCFKISGEHARVVRLAQWADEAEKRFLEVGFQVIVDPYNIEADHSGGGVLSPEFNLIGRMEAQEGTDHERMGYEIQHGMADGVVGKIDGNGNLRDPDLKL